MSYLDMVEKFTITQREESKSKVCTPSIEQIPYMTLDKLSKRDIAIEIHSEFLGCNIWLCSNEEMQIRIKQDNPEAVTYTVDEVMNLIKLKPNSEELGRIHNAKEVFMNSKIVDCSWDGENHDK